MSQQIMIMDEDYDPDYEPSREDIMEYAAILGMSPRSDAKYLPIAREGLKAQLPKNWKPAKTEDGEISYYNVQTQVLQEEHPLDEFFRRKFIEAKKADLAHQPSKTSNKLKNLCEVSRTEQVDYNLELHLYEQTKLKELNQYLLKSKEHFKNESQRLVVDEDALASDRSQDQGHFFEEIKAKVEDEFDLETAIDQLKEEKEQNIKYYESERRRNYDSQVQQIHSDMRNQIQSKQQEINKLQTQQIGIVNIDGNLSQYKQQLDLQFKEEVQRIHQQAQIDLQTKKQQIKQDQARQRQQIIDSYSANADILWRGQLRLLYREKLQLFTKEIEQNQIEELINEKQRIQADLIQEILNYGQYRQSSKLTIIQKINSEKIYLQDYYKQQLQIFNHSSLKQQEMSYSQMELDKSQTFNQSMHQPNLKVNYDLISQVNELQYQLKSIEGKSQGLESQIDNLRILDPQEIAKQQQINIALMRRLDQLDKELSNLEQAPVIVKSDQWVDQLESAKNWLILQKERLKYDKKQLKQIYVKLMHYFEKETVDAYNESVTQIRENQQILQNCEYMVQKMEENLKNYFQTRITEYLSQNEVLIQDLNHQKNIIENRKQIPIEKDPIYRNRSTSYQNQNHNLTGYLKTQKQALKDMKQDVFIEYEIQLNRSMQMRLN